MSEQSAGAAGGFQADLAEAFHPAPAEFSAQRMMNTVAALAALELAGRRVATPGGAAARTIVSAALTELDTVRVPGQALPRLAPARPCRARRRGCASPSRRD